MGIAAGTLQHAYKLFASMQQIISKIPADYGTNYNNKLANAKLMQEKSVDLAKNVTFDKIPEFSKIEMPDQKNFVKFDDSSKGDLEKVPVMAETLRHIIPPEVRAMQSELKTQIQNTLDQNFKAHEKHDQEQRAFLGQY